MSTALAIPLTIPEPTAITAVKTLTNLPSNFQHAMPSPTQQALTVAAEAQVLHEDSIVSGEKVHVSVMTPGGNGEDMWSLSHKGSAVDSVTAPTLMVATVGAGLSDKATPTSFTLGVNVWFAETDDGKVYFDNGPSISLASPLLGDAKTAPVPPSFLSTSEADFQSDPADLSSLVSQYPLADS